MRYIATTTMPNCRQCQSPFTVDDWDRKLLDRISPVIAEKKYSIPEPTLCPQCRLRRRLAWRPELHLFKRKSDLSGETMISMFPPEADCKVYSEKEWWSDTWDPLSFGRDFDFSRPFFEQFQDLIRVVPTTSLFVGGNENSEYINSASWNKNSYLLAAANYNEDCYYGNFLNSCKVCVDNAFLSDSEFCYESTDCTHCYHIQHSTNCHNCSDSYFLYNCRDCRNCFGSVNLANKSYMFMNEQLTREAYEKRLAKLELHRRSRVEEARVFFEKHRLKYPHKYMMGEMNENASGNAMSQCRNSYECFDVSNLEDCKYCSWFHNSKSCMDIYVWGFPGSAECYECLEVGDTAFRVFFCASTYNGSDMMYCYNTRACKNISGCVSLRHQEYCILNKKYSKTEYESLVTRIIEHMKRTGEWGQFFPMDISPMAYNQTIAQDYMPITREQATALGAKWNEEPPVVSPTNRVELPDSVNDADESICEQILTCQTTGKPYKIIPQEFKVYKRLGIPLPANSWEVRHKNRLARRNPRQLWDRQCMKCQAPIKTSYAPERPEIVYCENCYLKNIY